MKLIITGIPLFISGQCFSQSASTFASALGHNSVAPDTARRMNVTSVVKQPEPAVVTNSAVVDNNNGTMKVVHMTLQRSATLDPNRPPMMAIPATQDGQTGDANKQATPQTPQPK